MTRAIRRGALTAADQRVEDVMTRAVVCAHEGAVLKEIAAALARNHISTVPVVDDRRRVVGVVTASDLLTRISGDRGMPPRGHRLGARRETRRKSQATVAAELMTAPGVTVNQRSSVEEAARLAAYHHVRCMPAVDDAGVLVGIVSRSDLIKVYLREDDEVLRDIEDHVIREALLLDPDAVNVSVREGIVTLSGCLDRRQQVEQLIASVERVAGVIDVLDELGYRVDDSVSDYRPGAIGR